MTQESKIFAIRHDDGRHMVSEFPTTGDIVIGPRGTAYEMVGEPVLDAIPFWPLGLSFPVRQVNTGKVSDLMFSDGFIPVLIHENPDMLR